MKNDKKILLLGERCHDIFVYGSCERISPEAPVVIQRPQRVEENFGMAGNVKSNIISLSPDQKVDFFYQKKKITKTRFLDEASGQHLLRVDEENDDLGEEFAISVVDKMDKRDDAYSAFVFSDYNKGLLSVANMKYFSDIANQLNIPIFCDTKKILGEWSKGIDFVKINDREFKAQLAAGIAEPWKFCRNLIVTRGKNGIDLYNQDGEIAYHSNSRSSDVFSVVGCGDTVLAALVVMYLYTNNNIIKSIDYANTAAAIAASKPGVVSVAWQEVADWL